MTASSVYILQSNESDIPGEAGGLKECEPHKAV